jgi:hypothetical protein
MDIYLLKIAFKYMQMGQLRKNFYKQGCKGTDRIQTTYFVHCADFLNKNLLTNRDNLTSPK